MNGTKAYALAVMAWLAASATARADFTWLEDWQVDTQLGTGTFSTSTGMAHATSFVGFNPLDGSSGSISYHRDFLISNAPQGVFLHFSVFLDGNFSHEPHGVFTTVTATAQLEGDHLTAVADASPIFGNFTLQREDDSAYQLLAEGTYRISGSLSIVASSFQPLPAAFLSSDDTSFIALGFFTNSVVPEPSSVVLLSLGALGLAVTGRHRRRRAAC